MSGDTQRKLKVTAKVNVTMVLHLPDRWTEDAPASQVHEQAARSARFLIEKLLEASSRGELKVNDIRQHLKGEVLDVHPIMITSEETP